MFQKGKIDYNLQSQSSLNSKDSLMAVSLHSPILLRSLLVFFSMLGLSGVWFTLSHPKMTPIRHVKITGNANTQSGQVIQHIAAPFLQKSFWSLKTSALEQVLKRCNWIENVYVKRAWPDSLKIHVVARTPIAYIQFEGSRQTNNMMLIDQTASIFEPQQDFTKPLPLLIGSAKDASSLVHYYQRLQKIFELRALFIKSVRMDGQKRLFVELYNGIQLLLGNNEPVERIMRLLKVSPELLHQSHKIKSVDLRYSNGVAIKHFGLTYDEKK